MTKNLVIGIEGLVGTGKTSICKNLLNYIPNSIVLHAGNIYRAITYQMSKEKLENFQNVDLANLFKKYEIEIKIENRETVVFSHGKKIQDIDLQSPENSLAVSKTSRTLNNINAYKIVENYINEYKKKYTVIFSGRDTKKIYPDLDYHIFITADLDKRIIWKSQQYENENINEIRKNIIKRDKLQEESGYYKTYKDTIIIDVTSSNNIEDSTKLVLNHILSKKDSI